MEHLKNWQPKEFPPKTSMHGSYCNLVPLDAEKQARELYDAFELDTTKASWTYLPYGPFANFEEFKEWLISMQKGEDPQFYTILDGKTKRPLGLASYLRITPEHGVIEVGHLHFSKLLKKTPAATEAMFLMMQRAFDELKYRRYEWKCDSLNKPSILAAKRLGFSYEGLFRQDKVIKGRNRDTSWFSIIDTEWPALKKRFQVWLQTENFDERGHQIKKLSEISD